MSLEGLYPISTENGSIVLKDNDTDEAKYIIPSGYMTDANGAFSRAVEYTLVGKEGVYVFEVSADSEWVNSDERVFPVTVEPSVAIISSTGVSVGVLNSGEPDSSASSSSEEEIEYFTVSKTSTQEVQAVLGLAFIDLPLHDQYINVRYAQMQIESNRYTNDHVSSAEIGVHQINNSFTVENVKKLTWNSNVNYVAEPCYVDASNARSVETFNITSIVEGWLNRTDCSYSLLLKSENPGSAEYSKESICFSIYYNEIDLEKIGTWEECASIGKVSTYFNTFTGAAMAGFTDVENEGELFPISVRHLFKNASEIPHIYSNIVLGEGWNLNVFEIARIYTDGPFSKITNDDTHEAEPYVQYYISYLELIDASGNKNIFSYNIEGCENDGPIENDDPIIEYRQNENLATVVRNKTDGTLVYNDGYGNTKTYECVSCGDPSCSNKDCVDGVVFARPIAIEDINGNVIEYEYSAGNILSKIIIIPDYGYPITFKFSYDSSNRLTKITNEKTSDNISFSYTTSGGKTYLKYITYSSGKKYKFEYANGNICKIYDVTDSVSSRYIALSSYTREFYNGETISATSSINAHTSKGNADTISFSYMHNLTKVSSNGVSVYYAFDYWGNLARKYGLIANNDYTDCITYSIPDDLVSYNAVMLPNTNFLTSEDESSNPWSTDNGGTRISSNNVYGDSGYAVKVVGNSGALKYAYQSYTNPVSTTAKRIVPNTSYILSGWVKVIDSEIVPETEPFTQSSCGYSVVVYYSDGTNEEFRINANTYNVGEWQYVSRVVTLKDTTAKVNSIVVYCSYDYNKTNSYVLFDEINFSEASISKYTYNERGQVVDLKTDFSNESYMYCGDNYPLTYEKNGTTLQYEYDTNNNVSAVIKTGNGIFDSKTYYDYDDFGHVTGTRLTNGDETQSIVTSSVYSNSGQTLYSYTDERGKLTTYSYDSQLRLQQTKDPNGNVTRTNYYANSECTFADRNTNKLIDSNESYLMFFTDSTDETHVTSVNANGTKYFMSYDVDNNLTSISLDSTINKLAEYTYDAKNRMTVKTLGNGATESYTYNSLDNITKISYNANGIERNVSYSYNSDGTLHYVKDTKADTRETYYYDDYGRITKTLLSDAGHAVDKLTVEYKYDSLNRITRIIETAGSVTNTYRFTYYGQSEVVQNVTINTIYKITYEYDDLERLTCVSLTRPYVSTEIEKIEYAYLDGNRENQTTRYVASVTTGDSTFTYSYDANGNIISITETVSGSTSKTTTYAYDHLGQLIRENNPYTNKTYTYTYSIAGNMISCKQYAFTTSSTLGTVEESKTYSYGSGNRITSFNGRSITYDGAGNPLSWNGRSLSWEGNKLVSYTVGPSLNGFTYYENGLLATRGTYESVTDTTFYYDANGRLIYEISKNRLDGITTSKLTYLYDASGSIIGFARADVGNISNLGTCYYYGKNAQGDVIHIFDSEGNIVARYNYDAWGNCTIASDTSGVNIANINPIRYRSYYYDTYSGWYYLQSRFYDPSVGRFISPDDLSYLGANGDLLSYNLYAYCSNNPVNYSDPSGHSVDFVLDLFFIGWDIYDLINDNGWQDWGNWVSLIVDVVFAVIPFATGGGKLVKFSNNLSDLNKVTAIGETMPRVEKIVTHLGLSTDELYDGFKLYKTWSQKGKLGKFFAEIVAKVDNLLWLYGKLRKGYQIIDTGIDVLRPFRSSSYIVERAFMTIWDSRNIWKLSYHID